LNMSDQVLKIDENSDIRFWGSVMVMHGFAILWVWFSPLNLCLMPCMVSETWDFSHSLLF
jgi:hypothetical protein